MCIHIDKYKTQEVEQRNTHHKKEFNRNSSKKNTVSELENSTERVSKADSNNKKKRISELKADHLKLPSHRNKKKKRVKKSNETHLTSSLNQYMH